MGNNNASLLLLYRPTVWRCGGRVDKACLLIGPSNQKEVHCGRGSSVLVIGCHPVFSSKAMCGNIALCYINLPKSTYIPLSHFVANDCIWSWHELNGTAFVESWTCVRVYLSSGQSRLSISPIIPVSNPEPGPVCISVSYMIRRFLPKVHDTPK